MLDPKKIILTQIFEGGGGGSSVEVEPLSVTENGTYTADEGKAYSPVTANVPNSYAAGDEGKVVSNGALVSQTSDTATQNGTVDTTLINSLLVNVSGGGGGGLALLKTEALGTIQTSSTSAIDVGSSFTVPGCHDYDLLLTVATSSNLAPAASTHIGTVSMLYLTGTEEKTDVYRCSNMWNLSQPPYPVTSIRGKQTTSQRGIYPGTFSISDETVTLSFKATYNSSDTYAINGDYTVRVYGINLRGLIGV